VVATAANVVTAPPSPLVFPRRARPGVSRAPVRSQRWHRLPLGPSRALSVARCVVSVPCCVDSCAVVAALAFAFPFTPRPLRGVFSVASWVCRQVASLVFGTGIGSLLSIHWLTTMSHDFTKPLCKAPLLLSRLPPQRAVSLPCCLRLFDSTKPVTILS